MIGHLATVHSHVIDPETGAYGLNVVFRDGVVTGYSPEGMGTFARVLVDDAHPLHGSEQRLPRPGTLGVVMELQGGFLIWAGAIHQREANQVDPDPGLEARRHESGIVRQLRADGRAQWSHPSGLRITVSPDGKALPELRRKGSGIPAPEAARKPQAVEIEHPSGLLARISPEGDLVVTGAKTLQAKVTGDAAVESGGAIAFTASKASTFKAPQLLLDSDVEVSKSLRVRAGAQVDGAMEAASMKATTTIEAGGNITATDAILSGKPQKTHTHSGVTTGTGFSGPPV